MTEALFRIMTDQDKAYAVCLMIAAVIRFAIKLERYFKQRNENLIEV